MKYQYPRAVCKPIVNLAKMRLSSRNISFYKCSKEQYLKSYKVWNIILTKFTLKETPKLVIMKVFWLSYKCNLYSFPTFRPELFSRKNKSVFLIQRYVSESLLDPGPLASGPSFFCPSLSWMLPSWNHPHVHPLGPLLISCFRLRESTWSKYSEVNFTIREILKF